MDNNRKTNKTMKIRHIIIITITLFILSFFGLIVWQTWKIAKYYGVENAEIIRENIRLEKEIERNNETDSLINQENIKSVKVIRIKNQYNDYKIYSSGRVVSTQKITKTSEVQGELKGNYSLKKGTKFKKGDILFGIENRDFELLLKARKSRFLNLISSTLIEFKLDFPNEYEKWDIFFNTIRIDKNLPDLPQISNSKEKNFIISKSILSEHLSIQSDEERLKKYTVYAPFDGSIVRNYTDLGASVNPGSPIIEIIRDESLEIELPINKNKINDINIGDTVLIQVNDKLIFGNIIRKSNFVDISTQNISVFAKIPNNNKIKIFSGDYLKTEIKVKSKIKTAKIPRRSIINTENIYLVTKDSTLIQRNIKIYSSGINNIYVTGLEDNELIVCEPMINEKEGMSVLPIIHK